MATSKIALYRTEITPERNMWIENIHDYLVKKGKLVYSADDFQYIKIALNTTITIAANQDTIGNQSLGNYLELIEDNRSFYYFIIDATWSSKNAVKLTISMDTINTYGEDLNFTDKTVIQRQHENRFKPFYKTVDNGTSRLYFRNVDHEAENIVLPKIHTSNKVIKDIKGDFNWYLIYKTREDLTPTNTGNPIECDLIAENPLLIKKGINNNPEVRFENKDIIDGTIYYIDRINNPGGKFKEIRGTGGGRTWEFGPNTNDIIVFWKKNDSECLARVLRYRDTGYGYSLIDEGQNFIINLPIVFEKMESLGTSQGVAPNAIVNSWTDIVNLKTRRGINAGTIEDTKTLGIDSIDKTNSRLMKIIKLPYCPVNITFSNKGEYKFPAEWEFTAGTMRLTTDKLSTELENYICDDTLNDDMTIKMVPDVIDDKNMIYESKLYNSEFYTLKYVYDSFAKEIKLENVNILDKALSKDVLKLPIYFKPTNTVNSKFAFNFKRKELNYNYVTDKDYDDFLIVDRNNEETIFSNDYLNYIRNGYNYDKKAKNISLVQGLLGLGLGLGQAGAAFGVGKYAETPMLTPEEKHNNLKLAARAGKPVTPHVPYNISPFLSAAAISAGFGAVNGLIGTIAGQVSAQDSINAKLQQLSSQSSNVSGSDDVDLLEYYNGNRLEKKTYEIRDLAKQNIYNLFYYTGYSHPVQAIPNTDTRYWFNYIQCTPTFNNEITSNYSDYLTDIKTRFENGVTKFHYHPAIGREWDIEQEYENWEDYLVKPNEYTVLTSSSTFADLQIKGALIQDKIGSYSYLLLRGTPNELTLEEDPSGDTVGIVPVIHQENDLYDIYIFRHNINFAGELYGRWDSWHYVEGDDEEYGWHEGRSILTQPIIVG